MTLLSGKQMWTLLVLIISIALGLILSLRGCVSPPPKLVQHNTSSNMVTGTSKNVEAVVSRRKTKRTIRPLPDKQMEVTEEIEEEVVQTKQEETKHVSETKKTEVVERIVEKEHSQYTVGLDYTPPISGGNLQPLKEGVLGVSVGKRIFGRVWLEGRVASPLNTLKPSASVGLRLEL